jgi:hypothetical protein
MIESARGRALAAVNTALVTMHLPIVAAVLRQLPNTGGAPEAVTSWFPGGSSNEQRQRRCVSKPRVAVGYPGCARHEEHNPNGVVACVRVGPEPFPIVAPAVPQWVVGTVGGGRIPRFDAHPAGRCNPFGVVTASCRHPRVGAMRQPWAGGQNAFGVIRPLRPSCSLHSKLHEFYQLAAPVRAVNARPTAKPRKPH